MKLTGDLDIWGWPQIKLALLVFYYVARPAHLRILEIGFSPMIPTDKLVRAIFDYNRGEYCAINHCLSILFDHSRSRLASSEIGFIDDNICQGNRSFTHLSHSYLMNIG